MSIQSVYTGSIACNASVLANIDINLGFVPIAVEVVNRNNGCKIWWNDDMPSGSAYKEKTVGGIGLLHDVTITMHTSNKGNVNLSAFTVYNNGTCKDVSLTEKAMTASKTVTAGKWGCFGWEVAIDGTVDQGTNSATWAHATEAAAIADKAANTANHANAGYITIKAGASNYVTGTNTLDQAANVNYYGANCMSYVATLGITPLTSTTTTLSGGTTETGTIGFRIGVDTDLQVLGQTLYWRAYR